MQMHLLLHLLLYIYIEMKGCNRDCDFGYTDFGHTDFGYALAALPDMSAKGMVVRRDASADLPSRL